MEPLFTKRINPPKTFRGQTIKRVYIWPLISELSIVDKENEEISVQFPFWWGKVVCKMWELSKFGLVSLWEGNGCLPGELQHNNNKPLNTIWQQSFPNVVQHNNFFKITTTNLSTQSDKNVFLMLKRLCFRLFQMNLLQISCWTEYYDKLMGIRRGISILWKD